MAYHPNIFKLYLFRCFFWMHLFGAVLIPFFTDWGQLSLQTILFINGWFMLWSFLLEVPTGAIADIWGRKQALLLAAAATLLGSLIYASYPALPVFLLAEICFAISFTLASGSDQALAYDSLLSSGQEKNSKQILTKLESAKLLGISLGALLGAAIALSGNYRLPMLWQWLPASLALLTAFSLSEAPRQNTEKYHRFVLQGFKYFAKHRIILALTTDLVLIGALSWLMLWLYQALLRTAGIAVPWFGLIHVLIALAQIAVLNITGYLEKLLGQKKRVLLLLSLATGVCFILASLTKGFFLIFSVIGAIACGLAREPLFTNYLHKYIPSRQRATLLSIISMLKTLTIMFINILVGLFVNTQLAATTFGIGLAILSISLFSFFEEKHLQD